MVYEYLKSAITRQKHSCKRGWLFLLCLHWYPEGGSNGPGQHFTDDCLLLTFLSWMDITPGSTIGCKIIMTLFGSHNYKKLFEVTKFSVGILNLILV